ncbi:hypothetical protein HY448_01160 [Candidatus Pacearchaeota archaeon]|nr:hypothetical protein [Candidatus Pacearchaeota archaeon]
MPRKLEKFKAAVGKNLAVHTTYKEGNEEFVRGILEKRGEVYVVNGVQIKLRSIRNFGIWEENGIDNLVFVDGRYYNISRRVEDQNV